MAPLWATAHPCYERICPDPTAPYECRATFHGRRSSLMCKSAKRAQQHKSPRPMARGSLSVSQAATALLGMCDALNGWS
jgi:hypothetical protein